MKFSTLQSLIWETKKHLIIVPQLENIISTKLLCISNLKAKNFFLALNNLQLRNLFFYNGKDFGGLYCIFLIVEIFLMFQFVHNLNLNFLKNM